MLFVLTTWSDLQLKNYVTEWDLHENINYVAVGILIYFMSVQKIVKVQKIRNKYNKI